MTYISLTEQINTIADKIESGWYKSVDVDQGWHQIVVDLHDELCAIDPEHKILQIKEKFGALRYYYHTDKGEATAIKMDVVISKYEKIAAETCELTGNRGILMQHGFVYKTLDPEHAPEGWTPVGKMRT